MNRIHSECQIRTLVSLEDIADFSPLFTDDSTVSIHFSTNDKLMGAIITPAAMKCAFSEIENMKLASEIEIACHPEGGLCFSCNDTLMTYDGYLDILPTVLTEFYCKQERSWKYNRSLIIRCVKPLSLARKVFMRINQDGVVCIQHLINDDEDHPLFIDCFVHPLEYIA